MKLKSIAAAVAASCCLWAPSAQANVVGVELVLLVDVSGSIDNTEYQLQKNGYANAFRNPALHSKLANIPGGIAVTYVEWSSSSQQRQVVNWSLINSAGSANAFADAISNSTRSFGSGTVPSAAILFGTRLFGTETGNTDNGYYSSRQVIDVSGDGIEGGTAAGQARNAALAAGVDAINGLPIGDVTLIDWYDTNIRGGAGSFIKSAATFNDFSAAVAQKIEQEIGPGPAFVPEPDPLALLGLSVGGMVVLGRRRRVRSR